MTPIPAAENHLTFASGPVGGVLRLRSFWRTRGPRPGLTVTMLVGVAILLALGTWQVIRLQQKNTILRDVRAQLIGAAQDLRRAMPATDNAWRLLEHRPVTVQGTWLEMHRLKLAPRTYDDKVGYQLVVPLQLASGQVVLVNRGFAPDNAAIMPAPTGQVVVHGVVRLPETGKASRFTPDNIPSRGQWVWVDLPAMGHEIGVGPLAPVMIYEDRVIDNDNYPIGGQLPLPLFNHHQQYAVTWYCLALAFMAVWLVASGPKPVAADGTTADDTDPARRGDRYSQTAD